MLKTFTGDRKESAKWKQNGFVDDSWHRRRRSVAHESRVCIETWIMDALAGREDVILH